MNTIQFLLEWALRSSGLILGGGFLLLVLRVRDPAVRLAAWTAVLCGSLAIPLLREALPNMPIAVRRAVPATVTAPPTAATANLDAAPAADTPVNPIRPFDWPLAATAACALGALVLLLRVGIGFLAGLRLLRTSQPTGTATEGIEIRESERVTAPLTLGIARPAIVLPANWREWESRKLAAVLAHERSHVRRFDPAVQLLSAVHRALLWFSPLSWFLHTRIVRIAEEASDDAAVAVTLDRPSYAEILVDFMRGPVGVPMARYGNPDRRIHRILEGTVLSRGVTRWSVAAILALGSPIVYLAAAAHPQSEAPPAQVATEPAPVQSVEALAQSAPPAAPYISGIGTVTPSATVTVKPMIDGQLMSVDFKEGETVQAGQLLATIDPRPFQLPVIQAKSQIEQDQASLRNAETVVSRIRELIGTGVQPRESLNDPTAALEQINAKLQADGATLDRANLQISYTRIVSPIAGVAGLRRVDAGNVVHSTDPGGIVVITQLQPIAVIFTIPEDRVAEVLARLRAGANIAVEAWNRDASRKLATGRLTAVDNQIDVETGTAKLKAVFDNQDGALINGAFVNVRMFPGR